MFSEKILPWAKFIDLVTSAMGSISTLAKVELGSLPSKGPNVRKNVETRHMAFDTQRDLAAAYVRLARVNR